MVSAGTAVGRAAVASRDTDLFPAVRAFLDETFVSVAPLDAEQDAAAGDAYRRYGEGRHLAGLNLGNAFAYALARRRNLPLLFKGGDFACIDIEAA